MLKFSYNLPEVFAPWLALRELLPRHIEDIYRKRHSVTEIGPGGRLACYGPQTHILAVSGMIPLHTDHYSLPRYSYFAVLRNDGYIAKGKDQPHHVCLPQWPGAIMCLDIHEEHHVIRDRRVVSRITDDYPIWAALVFSADEIVDPERVREHFANDWRILQ